MPSRRKLLSFSRFALRRRPSVGPPAGGWAGDGVFRGPFGLPSAAGPVPESDADLAGLLVEGVVRLDRELLVQFAGGWGWSVDPSRAVGGMAPYEWGTVESCGMRLVVAAGEESRWDEQLGLWRAGRVRLRVLCGRDGGLIGDPGGATLLLPRADEPLRRLAG